MFKKAHKFCLAILLSILSIFFIMPYMMQSYTFAASIPQNYSLSFKINKKKGFVGMNGYIGKVWLNYKISKNDDIICDFNILPNERKEIEAFLPGIEYSLFTQKYELQQFHSKKCSVGAAPESNRLGPKSKNRNSINVDKLTYEFEENGFLADLTTLIFKIEFGNPIAAENFYYFPYELCTPMYSQLKSFDHKISISKADAIYFKRFRIWPLIEKKIFKLFEQNSYLYEDFQKKVNEIINDGIKKFEKTKKLDKYAMLSLNQKLHSKEKELLSRILSRNTIEFSVNIIHEKSPLVLFKVKRNIRHDAFEITLIRLNLGSEGYVELERSNSQN